MSTTVPTLKPRTSLATIGHYGKEALLNRWKMLLICSITLLFFPRLVALVLFNQGANRFVAEIRAGALDHGSVLDRLTEVVSKTLEAPSVAVFLSMIASLVGVLAIAHLSIDYFEQRPSTPTNATARAARTLLFKGLGAFVMVVLLLVPTSVMTLLRVVVLCLLVMLPLELAAGHAGGMRSVINTIFLRYATRTPFGRWPVFSNMMTVGGCALSVLFLAELGISYLGDIDVLMQWRAQWWIAEVSIFGSTMSRAFLVQHMLELIIDSTIIACVMPFAAALRYFSQKSTFELNA